MQNSLTPSEQRPEERQRAERAQTNAENRAWLKSFVLASALIVLTLTVATVLAGLVKDSGIRL
jgi:hypothetical protein